MLPEANNTLVMRIAQDDGTLDIALPGYAAAYKSTFDDRPVLTGAASEAFRSLVTLHGLSAMACSARGTSRGVAQRFQRAAPSRPPASMAAMRKAR